MSPLAPSGSRGYGDYQRTSNWDSGILFSGTATNQATPLQSSVFDVGRYAYLAGSLKCTLDSCLVQIFWWADAAGTVLLGKRLFTLVPQISQPAQIRIPNLGPFVSIVMNTNSGANWSGTAQVFATNRYHPCEFIPVNPVIVNESGDALAGNQQLAMFPTDYYAGPMHVWAFSGQNYFPQLQRLDTTNTWEQLTGFSANGGSNSDFTFLAPPGAWRILFINTTAVATTASVSCTPSLTGSS